MRRSTMPARLITIIIAVIVTPLAAGLLAAGGSVWLFTYAQYEASTLDVGRFAVPILLQAIGILLLLLVVLTGIWSSAGLIAVGVLAIVPLVFSLFPALLLEAYRLTSVVPREWIDGLAYGLPLILFPALGSMGLVLAIVRRSPAPTGTGLSIAGIVAAPVLLLGGALLLSWGLGRGTLAALQQFRFDVVPEAAAAVLGGVLLVIAGVLVTRWSTYALVLPAIALLAITALLLVPGAFFRLFAQPWEMVRAVPPLLLLGGGTAAALVYLIFTAMLLRVRKQAAAAPAVPTGPAGSMPTTAYPAAAPGARASVAAPPPAAGPQPYPAPTAAPAPPPYTAPAAPPPVAPPAPPPLSGSDA